MLKEVHTSAFSIRTCDPDDAEAVLTLWQQADATVSVTDTAEDIRKATIEHSLHFLVGEADRRIVASIIGTFDGWRGNIYRLVVHPSYRRRGFARALVREIGNRFAKQGVKRVTALVEKDHPWAMAFWKAVGYDLDQRMARFVLNL